MPARSTSEDTTESEAHIRLLRTIHCLWEEAGSVGISARQLSQSAAVPVSSIYYRFGSLEQLLVNAHEAALAEAEAWCAAQLAGLGDTRWAIDALPALLAALIDDWSHGQRRLAFAWREAQFQASRDTGLQAIGARWRGLWSGFWQAIGTHFGVAPHAVILDRLFDGESLLHMFRWRRTIDRAGLDEFARGCAAWFGGGPMPPAPWRDFARGEAIRAITPAPRRDDTATAIAEAAASVIARLGVANLTHRAVAAEAGLTLGIVSHRFRTSSDLLEAAFDTIYRHAVPMSPDGEPTIPTGDRSAIIAGLVDLTCRSAESLATEELFVAVARHREFDQFAAQLRYLRGRTSGRYLEAIMGPARPAGGLDAALLSSFVSGQIRAHRHLDEVQRRRAVRAELDLLFDLLAPH